MSTYSLSSIHSLEQTRPGSRRALVAAASSSSRRSPATIKQRATDLLTAFSCSGARRKAVLSQHSRCLPHRLFITEETCQHSLPLLASPHDRFRRRPRGKKSNRLTMFAQSKVKLAGKQGALQGVGFVLRKGERDSKCPIIPQQPQLAVRRICASPRSDGVCQSNPNRNLQPVSDGPK